jgi:endonuclease IV
MLRALPPAQRKRAGYGLDTCHLFASGYDLAASREEFTRVLDLFESTIGEPPSFFHLNDSEGALGSNRDRHVLIGDGRIGATAFGWLMQDKRSQNIPLILETPQKNGDVADDDDTPDPWDMECIARLQQLESGSLD